MLGLAIKIAAEAFEITTDRAKQPYILHCIRVMNTVKDEPDWVKCAAVLHDLIEDCSKDEYEPWTLVRLRKLGFPRDTINVIDLLTHEEGVDYMEYIMEIGTNREATLIKLADLKDNMDSTRLEKLSEKDIARMVKYHEPYHYLAARFEKLPKAYQLYF
jgi:(p)ppGpp synthase/HD superfamily hydrolase